MRFLPLLALMIWLSWSDRPTTAAGSLAPTPLLWMAAVALPLVAIMALWGRTLLRHHLYGPLPTRSYSIGLVLSRFILIAWYGICVFALGLGAWVDALFAPIADWHVRLPGMIVGTAPVLLGWMGLAWAAYPVERAVREGNLLAQLDAGAIVHAPPTLRDSLANSFRTQVLFLLAPILATVALRDVVALGFALAGSRMGGIAEGLVFLASIGLVFVAAPELLVRVLRARPLAPSPLRDRLDALARRLGLRYRDILVWHTSYGIGNAAVMGLLPRFRYVLLTDLLIETLDDRQIEAVFAHEAGHVQHQHLLWYVVFFAIFMLSMAGPGELVWRQLERLDLWQHVPMDLVVFAGFSLLFLAMFGMLSRLFERQADIYAARSVESARIAAPPLRTAVGAAGAESFVSALVRVAQINQMPVEAISHDVPRHPFRTLAARAIDSVVHFLHPSVPARVAHLRSVAEDASQTERFDRRVAVVTAGMVVVLLMLATWVGVGYLRPQTAATSTTHTPDPIELYDVH